MKIIHIITDLDTGGAEMMLHKLLSSLHDEALNSSVISLMGRGKITERIEALGVKVETLDLGQGERPSWQTIKKLRQFMRAFNPALNNIRIKSSYQLPQSIDCLPTRTIPLL